MKYGGSFPVADWADFVALRDMAQTLDGAGMDYVSLGLVCEELEYVDTSLRVIMSVHAGLHGLTLLTWGSDDQKRRWLPSLCSRFVPPLCRWALMHGVP